MVLTAQSVDPPTDNEFDKDGVIYGYYQDFRHWCSDGSNTCVIETINPMIYNEWDKNIYAEECAGYCNANPNCK